MQRGGPGCETRRRRLAAGLHLAGRGQFVDDLRDVTAEHLGQLVAVDVALTGDLVEFTTAEHVLDLLPVDRLVGPGADPRIDLVAEPLVLELLDDLGQLLGRAAAEDLREDVLQIVRGGHALSATLGLRGTLLGLGSPLLRRRCLLLLLRGAFENLLENFTENIHRHASE